MWPVGMYCGFNDSVVRRDDRQTIHQQRQRIASAVSNIRLFLRSHLPHYLCLPIGLRNKEHLFLSCSVIMTLIKTYRSKKEETDDNLYMRWEQDKDLSVMPDLGLFDEYLEMGKRFFQNCTGRTFGFSDIALKVDSKNFKDVITLFQSFSTDLSQFLSLLFLWPRSLPYWTTSLRSGLMLLNSSLFTGDPQHTVPRILVTLLWFFFCELLLWRKFFDEFS